MNFWETISNLGIKDNKLDNWEKRNLRLMNSITFIMACSLVFFSIMGIVFKLHEGIPLLIVAFIITIGFYFIRKFTSFVFSKIYFCVIPTLIISLYASTIVGEVSNDKYYIIVSSLIPLIIFKKRKYYIPLLSLNISAFFLISYFQSILTPLTVLKDELLVLYTNINASVIFLLIYFLFKLFFCNVCDLKA